MYTPNKETDPGQLTMDDIHAAMDKMGPKELNEIETLAMDFENSIKKRNAEVSDHKVMIGRTMVLELLSKVGIFLNAKMPLPNPDLNALLQAPNAPKNADNVDLVK